jgi:endonuclease/exonuclease/phosphatase family metal-dependent hydrolase
MNSRLRTFARRSFIFITILSVLLYGLVCLVPFLDAGEFWFIAMLGLVFPLLFIVVLICGIVWGIRRSKWGLLCLAVLLLSWQQLSVLFALRTEKEFSTGKDERTLRVLSWNVSRWDEANKKLRGGTSYRQLMFDLVEMQYADVLCFQEFFESFRTDRFDVNIPVLEKMGYPYHIFLPKTRNRAGVYHIGVAIFSRYPIIDSASFATPFQENAEGLCYADIRFGDQPVRIMTTHLESARFDKEDYEGMGSGGSSGAVFSKLKRAYEFRSSQADMVRAEVMKSPIPVVLCGDMNDIPNSYTYFTVRGHLQDAFLKKGAGLGKTFRFLSPTLRIDYIFADKRLKVDQFARHKVSYSDHYPIVADLQFPAKP